MGKGQKKLHGHRMQKRKKTGKWEDKADETPMLETPDNETAAAKISAQAKALVANDPDSDNDNAPRARVDIPYHIQKQALQVKKPLPRKQSRGTKARKGKAVGRALELAERDKVKNEKKAAKRGLRDDARKQWA
eukprot:c7847_g1_i1.p1 GENE.c7847_g1_i1~~c7847_g1_i1.p1  ORF type:complete len:134 (-),score=41.08 c7847_g1_i1:29-430(-)